jgi:chorismate--pyruvate lyase
MARCPHWQSPQRLINKPPFLLRPWLLAQGSLTCQLRAHGAGQFRVQPIREQFARPARHEARLLGIPVHQYAWIREVYLHGADDQAWVLARSVIPIRALRGRGRRLRHLGSRSLGSLLFARQPPRCQREVALLAAGWARRSRYDWCGQPLLVQECFLPEFAHSLEC